MYLLIVLLDIMQLLNTLRMFQYTLGRIRLKNQGVGSLPNWGHSKHRSAVSFGNTKI